MPACQACSGHLGPRWRLTDAAHRGGRRGPRRRLRRVHLRGTRRWPLAFGVYGEDVRGGDPARLRGRQASLRPRGDDEPWRYRRLSADGPAATYRPRPETPPHEDEPLLRGPGRLRDGRRAVQREWFLPQEDRGHDVSLLYGDPRRTGHHEGPGQHAQVRDRRHPPARGADRTTHEGGH